MAAATEGTGKSISTNLGQQVVYLSTVADTNTFASRFGTARAAFFQGTTVGGIEPVAVGLTLSGGTVTFAISGTVTAGYLQVWGE